MHLRRPPGALLALTALVLLIPAGCAKKKNAITTPRSGPTANFSATPRVGNRPLDVDFTDLSTPGTSEITSVLWDFGDRTPTSTTRNVRHLYGAPGTYTVSLTVTTADGTDTETKVSFIVVGNGPGTSPPNAAFTASPTGGQAPVQIQFTDQSTAGTSPITAWSWNFGNGDTSNVRSPNHTYITNGIYTVTLSVTTAVGTDTETKPGYIVVTPSPVPPTAQFNGTPRDGPAPLTVDFTDQSSQGSASITAWAWTFGDGGTSSVPNPSHTYAAAGNYTVSLTVTTSVGSDGDTQPAYITVHPTPGPPTAQFSGTPTSGPAPLTVNFTDQSAPGTSPITSRSWNFGDGSAPSTATNPSHTYGAIGTYTVTLTVTTNDGQDSEIKTGYIQVCTGPAADFAGLPTAGVAPLLVQFTDLTPPPDTLWSWNFGDGTVPGAVKNPSHAYAAPGTYGVSLRVQNACGRDSVTKTGYITVTDACPNPVYTIANANWANLVPPVPPDSTYHTSGRLYWDANVSTGCSKLVFGKIYARASGDTAWVQVGQSVCYTITGNSAFDRQYVIVSGLARNCYDFRIDLYECAGAVVKATRGPANDTDLTGQCFEP